LNYRPILWAALSVFAIWGVPAAGASEWDGTWFYAFRGIQGPDCGRFTKGSIKIRDGKFVGKLFNIDYGDFTVTGGLREDGTLDNVQFVGADRQAKLAGQFYKDVANGNYEGTFCSGEWEMFQIESRERDIHP